MAYLIKENHNRNGKIYSYWYVVKNIRIGKKNPKKVYIKYLGNNININKEKKKIPQYEREFYRNKTLKYKLKQVLHSFKSLFK